MPEHFRFLFSQLGACVPDSRAELPAEREAGTAQAGLAGGDGGPRRVTSLRLVLVEKGSCGGWVEEAGMWGACWSRRPLCAAWWGAQTWASSLGIESQLFPSVTSCGTWVSYQRPRASSPSSNGDSSAPPPGLFQGPHEAVQPGTCVGWLFNGHLLLSSSFSCCP